MNVPYLQHGEQSYPLEHEVTLGRASDCDIVIEDSFVSRRHASVKCVGSQFFLYDLASRNGTFLNSEPVSGECPLTHGDVIRLGTTVELTFTDPKATIVGMRRQDLLRIRIDPMTHDVWVSGQLISPSISRAQYALLSLLLEHPGQVVDRATIRTRVWPEEDSSGITDEAIDALVRRLHARLGLHCVATVRGHGLRLIC